MLRKTKSNDTDGAFYKNWYWWNSVLVVANHPDLNTGMKNPFCFLDHIVQFYLTLILNIIYYFEQHDECNHNPSFNKKK